MKGLGDKLIHDGGFPDTTISRENNLHGIPHIRLDAAFLVKELLL